MLRTVSVGRLNARISWRVRCAALAVLVVSVGAGVANAQDPTAPATVVIAPVAAAATPTVIAPGARIRVTGAPDDASAATGAMPRRIVGRFLLVDSAALWLNTAAPARVGVWPAARTPAPARVHLPLAAVRRLDLEVPKRGSRRSRMLVGAAIVGTATGVLLYNASHPCPPTERSPFCFDLRAPAAGAGVIAGAFVGSFLGYLRGPKWQWREVRLPLAPSPLLPTRR